MPVRPAAILFDVDGTLVDTYRLYLESYSRALAPVLGRAPTHAEIAERVPTAERGFLIDWIGESRADAAHAAMASCYRDLHRQMCDGAYSGVHEMLAALRAAGYPLGVVTGKSRVAWAITAEHLPELGDWATVVTEDEMLAPKPDPAGLLQAAAALGAEPARIVYVGDSRGDMIAAHAAGMGAAAALWPKTAPGEAEQFLASLPRRPTWNFARPADLTRAWAAWC